MNLLFMTAIGIFDKPLAHHITKAGVSITKMISSLIPDPRIKKEDKPCGENPNKETFDHLKDAIKSTVKAVKKAAKPPTK